MGIFEELFGLNAKRKRALTKAPKGPMKDFLSVAFPDNNLPLDQISILAVDFETTGLDSNKDQLLSIGYVEIKQGKVLLSTATHIIIKCEQDLSADNVAIHQITDQEKDEGVPLVEAIEQLLTDLAGKVMLAHYAKIEKTFLNQACLQCFGSSPIYPILDTLAIAKKRLDKTNQAYDPSQLRLGALRDSFLLPTHYAHNALNDAVATAELILAEVTHKEQPVLLKQLL